MGRMKALLLGIGQFLVYGFTLKTATSYAYSEFTIQLPNYDWFLLAIVAFVLGVFAFFQETDVKHAKAFGGLLKNLFVALYTYLAITMASLIIVGYGETAFIVRLDWGIWIYVLVFPALLNGLIHLIKPYTEKD